MKDTLNPDEIYDAFELGGFSILRIDNFYDGKSAEIRAELNYGNVLTVNNLQEITLKLKMIEENEGIKIEIVHIDMNHKTIRINFSII